MDRISLNRDYKPERVKTEPASLPYHRHILLLAGIALGIALILVLAPHTVKATRNADDGQHGSLAPVRQALPLNLPSAGEKKPAEEENSHTLTAGQWRTATVKQGDNLSLIFKRLGLSAAQLQQIVDLGEPTRALRRLYPGDTLRFNIDPQGRLLALIHEVSPTTTLRILRQDAGFQARLIERHPERRIRYASATIDNALFLAAQKAGLSDNITMELAGIFGWDIDFSLDIRKGDSFTVVYEELYLNGEKLRDGNILAAEFINRGRIHRAVRFTDDRGRSDYYSPDGRSMRKAFLRSPVAFTRISSRFSLGRRHPILHHIRAHKGVDYAAPRGTPIKATGDGKVVFKGTKGGYGKTIVIQHGSRYSTLYAHMSGFARGIRTGRRVRQGQVIGYVGSTGLATGPHLHYEFRVNGIHRNPLTVKLPDASPLPRRYLREFRRQAQPLLAQLDLVRRSTLALNENSP
ncbi:MAG TPA: peptidase M23 [Gammaproteobacteria bacterium]|nr:peptidase M23 [Gammaproteobacteria bacterium]